MRRLVLVCATALTCVTTAGLAHAQTTPTGAPTQGQAAYPLMGASPATVNSNNNMAAVTDLVADGRLN